MSININITNEQFYHMFKDSQFLSGMTFAGVDSVLDYMDELSEDSSKVTDWTEIFMNCGEYSQKDFIEEFAYVLEDDARENYSDNDDYALAIAMDLDQYVRIAYDGPDTKYIVFEQEI